MSIQSRKAREKELSSAKPKLRATRSRPWSVFSSRASRGVAPQLVFDLPVGEAQRRELAGKRLRDHRQLPSHLREAGDPRSEPWRDQSADLLVQLLAGMTNAGRAGEEHSRLCRQRMEPRRMGVKMSSRLTAGAKAMRRQSAFTARVQKRFQSSRSRGTPPISSGRRWPTPACRRGRRAPHRPCGVWQFTPFRIAAASVGRRGGDAAEIV